MTAALPPASSTPTAPMAAPVPSTPLAPAAAGGAAATGFPAPATAAAAASGPSAPGASAGPTAATPSAPAGASTAPAASAAVVSAAAVAGVASAAQVGPILAAAQAALAQPVNLSAQAQQAIKAEAFAQLVSQLVQHIQGGSVQLPANWPAAGVAPQWQALLAALIQQASAGQPLPQQLVSAQAWPAVLAQAVLHGAGQPAVNPAGEGGPPVSPAAPAAAGAGASTAAPTAAAAASASAAVPGAGPGTASSALLSPAATQGGSAGGTVQGGAARSVLPLLQNWLVQQGVVEGSDGPRSFTLTLKVPVAWAQAQSALGQALPAAPAASGASAMSLPWTGSVQQLSQASFGLVLQPQGLPAAQAQAMRASAVLLLEWQPLPAAAQQATQQALATGLLPSGMGPQEAYQALLSRQSDPWLHMAQQSASDPLPRERQHHGSGPECDRAGCQYQGRAECAQPFCAEMNSIWAADRASRR